MTNVDVVLILPNTSKAVLNKREDDTVNRIPNQLVDAIGSRSINKLSNIVPVRYGISMDHIIYRYDDQGTK
jgi:hypothetical protein